ncbi:putative hemolysin [Acetobacter nitrogenifigens]|uniref:putative hemolysin n=1 Tax=Acetobacter nitrogenifigens TaxID=285268 RepID=UPI000A052F96|nr:DUF333 domain-containing protein [Acetobacter nitrogenifigens]
MKRLFCAAMMACGIVGCGATQQPSAVGMANPASVYCQKQGGGLEIRKERDGQVGYCHLPDGRTVEEWALFRSSRS